MRYNSIHLSMSIRRDLKSGLDRAEASEWEMKEKVVNNVVSVNITHRPRVISDVLLNSIDLIAIKGQRRPALIYKQRLLSRYICPLPRGPGNLSCGKKTTRAPLSAAFLACRNLNLPLHPRSTPPFFLSTIQRPSLGGGWPVALLSVSRVDALNRKLCRGIYTL